MADVLGMSRRRDTSSYYHGPSRGERFRGVWYDRYQEE
jgi:hypothetical protein